MSRGISQVYPIRFRVYWHPANGPDEVFIETATQEEMIARLGEHTIDVRVRLDDIVVELPWRFMWFRGVDVLRRIPLRELGLLD
jgi:hypothetical protein